MEETPALSIAKTAVHHLQPAQKTWTETNLI
jgi:hypothetical protein